MNIIRKIKLSNLGYYTLNESERQIEEYINDYILNLRKFYITNSKNFIFYYKGDIMNWIFIHDITSNKIIFNYFIDIKFNHYNIDIKYICEYFYKLKNTELPIFKNKKEEYLNYTLYINDRIKNNPINFILPKY